MGYTARRSVVIRPVGPASAQVQSERSGLSQEMYGLAANLSADERALVIGYVRGVATAISRRRHEK
ncbi:MAG: hypothetical protein HC822_25405 [Oscillochloris sp.]|nr:hypothetical protein [Oscillochloris sp.]